MAKWCRKGCGKRVYGKGLYLCAKCSRKSIDDSGLSKAKGSVVYGLYNLRSELVYVGVTNSAQSRVSQHTGLKQFDHMKIVKRFGTRKEADEFEVFAIWNLRPPMNKKIDEPIKQFDKTELDCFAAPVAKSGPHICQKCDTVLSRYNTTNFCGAHTERLRPKRKKQWNRSK